MEKETGTTITGPTITVEAHRTVKLHDEDGRIHAEFEAVDDDVLIRQKGQSGRTRKPVKLAALEEAIAALKAKS